MTDRLADSIMPRLVEPTPDAIAEASRLLERGQLVVFPTETVYGLGGDTRNVEAIRKIYALKGRPADNPLIAHVYDDEQARRIAVRWDDRFVELGGDVEIPEVEPLGLAILLVKRLDDVHPRDRVREQVGHVGPLPPRAKEDLVHLLAVTRDRRDQERDRRGHHEAETPVEVRQHDPEPDQHDQR